MIGFALCLALFLNGLCFLQWVLWKLSGDNINGFRLLKTTQSSSVKVFQRIPCILNVSLTPLLAVDSKLVNWETTCFF